MECLYYDDADIVKMCIHAGYRNRFLIKKGTQRSQAKMLQSIKEKIEEEHSKIRNAEQAVKYHNETLKMVEAGDTSVYL
jgi:ribosomal protein L9